MSCEQKGVNEYFGQRDPPVFTWFSPPTAAPEIHEVQYGIYIYPGVGNNLLPKSAFLRPLRHYEGRFMARTAVKASSNAAIRKTDS